MGELLRAGYEELAEPAEVKALSAHQCLEHAISCLNNRDKRDCVRLWINRALDRMGEDTTIYTGAQRQADGGGA